MEYKKIQLKELIDYANTGADAIQRAPIVEYDTGIRCIRIGDISNNRKYDEWGYTKITDENYKKYKLDIGDILIARTGSTIGISKIIKNEVKSVYNNGLIKIKVNKEKCNSNYFYYILQSKEFINYIQGIAFGTTGQPNMKINDFLKFQINDIHLEKQNKIVNILSKIDEKIELNNQTNDNLLNLIDIYYDEIFTNIVCKKRADEIANITIGKTPPRIKKECFTQNNSDIKWLSISDIGKCGVYVFNTSEKLTQDAIDTYNVKVIPENTVVLSFKLTVGRVAITNEKMATNEAIAHINLYDEKLKSYIYTYLRKFDYNKLGSTSSIATAVNSKIIKSMPIEIPTEKDLEKFNELADGLLKMIRLNEKENIKLEQLRDTLLPKLMNGEIDLDKIEI